MSLNPRQFGKFTPRYSNGYHGNGSVQSWMALAEDMSDNGGYRDEEAKMVPRGNGVFSAKWIPKGSMPPNRKFTTDDHDPPSVN